MRVADFICDALVDAGVRKPFVVTGRGSLFLTDALARNKALDPVCMHHEQAAAFAAVAVSMAGTELGCAIVSTGCASTNCITGVLSAWQDEIPVIFVSGQNTLAQTTRHTGTHLRTFGQQEADIVSLVEPITKYAAMVQSAESVAHEVYKALSLAFSGRPGPVWLDIPLDIQSAHISPRNTQELLVDKGLPGKPSSQAVLAIGKGLSEAKRPIILVGGRCRNKKISEQIAALSLAYDLPVVFSHEASTVFGAKNLNSIGSVGAMGCSRAGAFALQNSDYLLVLGARLDSLLIGPDPEYFARRAMISAIDSDITSLAGCRLNVDYDLTDDISTVLEAVAITPPSAERSAWLVKCQYWKELFRNTVPISSEKDRVDLHELASILTSAMQTNAIFVCDSGFCDVILPTNIEFGGTQLCIRPHSQGAMGFAIPASAGIAASVDRPVVVVVGDGSLMMNLQELQTIAQHQLNIKIFVISNDAYGIIRKRQRELFRKRTIGTDSTNGVSCPKLEGIADAFGMPYRKISSRDDVSVLRELLLSNGPLICEVPGALDQQYLEIGYLRSPSGKSTRRPLEDQKPFLDRDTILSEMVIELVDD